MVLRNFGFEYALRILVGLSSVNRNRLSQSHSMSELSCEYVSLNIPRRIVVVVIEADLAPSDVAGVCHGFNTVVVSTLVTRVGQNTQAATGREGRGKCIHIFLDIAGIRLGFMPAVMAHIRAHSIRSHRVRYLRMDTCDHAGNYCDY